MTSRIGKDKRIKILNLYAGIGGNVHLLDRSRFEVTSVEYDNEIAETYKILNPSDRMIITDAKEYLLEHYREYDIIWASPPCQSHSWMRLANRSKDGFKAVYPDMALYEIILFLEKYCYDKKWVVENVNGWTNDFFNIKYFEYGRHRYWTNAEFVITPMEKHTQYRDNREKLRKYLGFPALILYDDSECYEVPYELQWLRNCVHPVEGFQIFRVDHAGV